MNKKIQSQIDFINSLNAFDEAYYLSQFKDNTIPSIDLATHYINTGWREGRNPNIWFDNDFYLKSYKDVAQAGVNPLSHYLRNDPCRQIRTVKLGRF